MDMQWAYHTQMRVDMQWATLLCTLFSSHAHTIILLCWRPGDGCGAL